ncbi:YggS family pyridoxal phosphate-dependent enzyme [Rhodobium gokarnense]|uniref:Pyridoxal phosphate homeostasis protein n=1 Tax=Rhodobium gokarnense TaxID=364296 RepID=A0ABT3HDY1_9HYPH|nr:YggS family pyridoxal phosphate-dependent enzyme [Rhodobium gokarnense]MCW2308613.1 pyridoxal phosphate enzyme (YggS family) [Rhodobium gokarnense]
MSAEAVRRLAEIHTRIARAEEDADRPEGAVTLVAVSKTFEVDDIRPVLAAGQRVFGENRVQEAQKKWPLLKDEFRDVELHLIGPMQSNKVKDAVALFDVIHTVDREKIARALSEEIEKQGRAPALLVQVNTGAEPQKAGVLPDDTTDFVKRCREEYGLALKGLMCIPPVEDVAAPHFALLQKLADGLELPWLSMGMSADFETAVGFGATHVRVGSAIFGARDYG